MKWYAVMTKVRKEHFATENLRRQGYEVFYPHYIQWTKPKKTKPRELKKPYLTRYVFVGMDGRTNQSFYGINNTFGVSTVVYCGYGALAIPESIVEEIKDRADENGRIALDTEEKPPFPGKKGDWIKFKEGNPLFGFIAELKKVDKSGKLVVKLDRILGEGREVTIHRDDVGQIIPMDNPHGQ